ncbi:MAG: SH3 domain-containing protein [Anaerolineales bacterium]|nr:SH3 domain-containing protein [Anaerolineales bacterium]
MLRRFFFFLMGGALLIALTACGVNAPQPATMVITPPPPPPTNTLALVITATLRVTATPIPTATFLPSETPLPTSTPELPTATLPPPTAAVEAIRGAVNNRSQVVNLRLGPSTDYTSVGRVNSGTTITILGFSDDRQWYFVVADGIGEGWMSAEFVTVSNASAVAVVPQVELTRRAENRPPTAGQTPVATLPGRATRRTDVLAYCDLPDFKNEQGKRFTKDTAVTLYWSWYAQTQQQTQDHINAAKYEVALEKKDGDGWRQALALDTWMNYRTEIIRQSGRWYVYWFVPVGKLAAGDYRISYKLTWSQKIDDGSKTFGPGGIEEINTGTCLFSVN